MSLKTVFFVRYCYSHGGCDVSIINRKEYEYMTIYDDIQGKELNVLIDEEYEKKFDESKYFDEDGELKDDDFPWPYGDGPPMVFRIQIDPTKQYILHAYLGFDDVQGDVYPYSEEKLEELRNNPDIELDDLYLLDLRKIVSYIIYVKDEDINISIYRASDHIVKKLQNKVQTQGGKLFSANLEHNHNYLFYTLGNDDITISPFTEELKSKLYQGEYNYVSWTPLHYGATKIDQWTNKLNS